MSTTHIKRMKLSEFRDSYFSGDDKPCTATLKNHIQTGRLSGQKLGGTWYVTVTGWGEPLYYGDKAQPSPAATTKKLASTGNAIADRILKLATAA